MHTYHTPLDLVRERSPERPVALVRHDAVALAANWFQGNFKGEIFYAGPHAGKLTGRTGIWYFDTRDLASRDLANHLRCIVELLYPEPGNLDRVNELRHVMGREHATAHVSCFWFGKRGALPPTVPERPAPSAGLSARQNRD